MTIDEVPKKCFERLNNAGKTGDYSLILDMFLPTALLQYHLEKPLNFQGPELIIDGLKQLTQGATFVISEPALGGNEVAVNFDLYAPGSQPVGGTATFTVNEKGKIARLTVVPRT